MKKKKDSKKMPEKVIEMPMNRRAGQATVEMILCQANGCKCTICGGFFEACDDICSLGQHQIGRCYPIGM